MIRNIFFGNLSLSKSLYSIWDIKTDKVVEEIAFNENPVKSVYFQKNKNKTMLYSTSGIRVERLIGNELKRTCFYKGAKRNAKFFSGLNDSLLYLCYSNGYLYIDNMFSHKTVDFFKAHQGEITRLIQIGDHLITAGKDGTIRIWFGNDEFKEVVRFSLFDNQNFLISNFNNFYTGTLIAILSSEIVIKNVKYQLTQFDNLLNRPDTVFATIPWIPVQVKAQFKSAQKLREANFSSFSKNLNLDIVPSSISVSTLTRSQTNDTETATFKVAVNGTINEQYFLHINVNGVPLANKNSIVFSSQDKNVSLSLSNGLNNIDFYAEDKNGILSNTVRLRLTKEIMSRPSLYIVSLGISDESIDSKSDIDSLNGRFAQQEKFYEKILFESLVNHNLNTESLSALGKKLSYINVDDVVIFYIAGHGNRKDGEYRLITSNESKQDVGLSYKKLVEIIEKIPARNKLMLINSCKSGNIYVNPGKRGLANDEDVEFLKSIFYDFSQNVGSSIIASTSGDKVSHSWNGKSFFITALIEALDIYKVGADKNNDYTISLNELKEFMDVKVEEISRSKIEGFQQKPSTRNQNYENDFSIWKRERLKVNYDKYLRKGN